MRRLILMFMVAAIMVVIMAANAMPAIAKSASCKVYDQQEWYLLTGQNSEYGGTWCMRH